MNKISLSIILALFLLNPKFCFSQGDDFTPPEFAPSMPPSPEAAAMLKFTDLDVNLPTGTPNISIPIYEVVSGQLHLPISLKYNASGIRVNEDASNVGLAWSVEAEGVITKSVFGKNDDNSWQTNGLGWDNSMLMTNDQVQLDLLKGLATGSMDGVPDIYNYSFNGYSGKFIVLGPNQIHMIPQRNLKIEGVTGGWKITIEDGTQYSFTEAEATVERTATSVSKPSKSWYLTKIASANETDQINLVYDTTNYYVTVGDGYTLPVWFNPISEVLVSGYTSIVSHAGGYVHGKQLKSISFNNGVVDYDIAWNDRGDHNSTLPGYHVPRIRKITVSDRNDNIIKVAHFYHGYYNEGAGDVASIRLRLDKMVVNASPSNTVTTTPLDQVYTFVYDTTNPLPSRVSLGIDHWGFYNGADNNQTLIPSFTFPHDVFQGGNREPNPAYVKTGILTKIIYPTGGYSQFFYDPNTIPPADLNVHDSIQHHDSSIVVSFFADDAISYFDENSNLFHIPNTPLFANGVKGTLTGGVGIVGNPALLPHNNTGVSVRRDGNILVRGHGFTYPSGITFTDTITLFPPYDYFLNAHSEGDGYHVTIALHMQWPDSFFYHEPEHITGGIRISKIVSYDPYTNKSTVKKFGYNNPATGYSSGTILRNPIYSTSIKSYMPYGNPMNCTANLANGFLLTGTSTVNVGQGSNIYYGYVTEYNGDNAEGGYSTSNFSDYHTFGNVNGEFDGGYSRGLLLNKKDYNQNNTLLHEITNHYTFDNSTNSTHAGRSVIQTGAHPCSGNANDISIFPIYFSQRVYSFPSEWLYTDKTTEVFNYPSSTMTNVTEFSFENSIHKQVTKVKSYLSDGSQVLKLIKYPTDFTLPSSSVVSPIAALIKMKNKHMDNVRIETVTQKVDPSGNIRTNEGWVTEFKVLNTDWIVPDKLYSLRIASPLNSFSLSTITGGNFVKDSHYVMETETKGFDVKGNVTELSSTNETSAFMFGYNKEYPTAKVTNAQAGEIGFTSFEDTTKGNWSYDPSKATFSRSLTGKKAYDLTGSPITFTGTPPVGGTNFVVSFWKVTAFPITVSFNGAITPMVGNVLVKGGIAGDQDAWTYYEYKFPWTGSGTITISGVGTIDELRAYPEDARMETYTYNPLVGITSKCDISSFLFFYQYDALGRLKVVRDQNQKIVRKTEYGFQKPE